MSGLIDGAHGSQNGNNCRLIVSHFKGRVRSDKRPVSHLEKASENMFVEDERSEKGDLTHTQVHWKRVGKSNAALGGNRFEKLIRGRRTVR